MSKFFEFLVFAPNSSDGKDVSTGVKRTATHSRNRSPSSCSHRPLLLSEHKGRTVLLLYPPLARVVFRGRRMRRVFALGGILRGRGVSAF